MILFYSKEAVRRACQREVKMDGKYSPETIKRSAMNLVWNDLLFVIKLLGNINFSSSDSTCNSNIFDCKI